jgi:3-dehydroquinate synthase
MRRMSNAMRTVKVQLHNHAYDIRVGSNLLDSAGEMIRAIVPSKKMLVLTDSQVAKHHLPTLVASLQQAGIEAIPATIPAGETFKTVETLLPVFDTFLSARIDRRTPLIALGGGVIGDMGGFVAATLLRGVPFVQIPTTLLSMVDASVGGKTGVNHTTGKNLIGAFHQPHLVIADVATLQTLPPRELKGGLAECIKHDIIRDGEHFKLLSGKLDLALSVDLIALTDLVAHNVAIKARVVEADPFEKAERAHLNFGHTFGHAIEQASSYSYSHGESVALGMCAAAHASMQLGMISADDHAKIVAMITRAQLPSNGLTLPTDNLIRLMGFDKKVAAGKIRFILPDRIGHVVIRDDVADEVVRKAIESLR